MKLAKLSLMGLDSKTKLKFVVVPAGKYDFLVTNMGEIDRIVDKDCLNDGTCVKINQSIKGFLLSESEVTVGQYRACVDENQCTRPQCGWLFDSKNTWTSRPKENEEYPVNCLNIEQMQKFLDWSGTLLPYSYQWHYAAGAGKPYTQNYLDQIRRSGWTRNNSNGSLHKVKQKKGNGFGLFDMGGNLNEMTNEVVEAVFEPKCYRAYGGSAFDQSTVNVAECLGINERNKSTGFRVMKKLPSVFE